MYSDELVMGAHVYAVMNEHATRQVPGYLVYIRKHKPAWPLWPASAVYYE